MLSYIQYLNIPTKVAIVIVAIFLIIQVIGEILEFKGKVVPEFVKIRKIFIRRKEEKEILHQVPTILKEFRVTLDEFNAHYSKDNISKRNKWIENVNRKLEENDDWAQRIDKKIDKSNKDINSILLDTKKSQIINFASTVIDENAPVTHEQFNRIFKVHTEYEELLKENGLKNGETDIAFHIIQESYENHMKNHTFVEDIRGYKTTN